MNDLVAFLRARLDEEQRNAEAAETLWIESHFTINPGSLVLVQFYREHVPARVLREVEAKRAILDRYEQWRAFESTGLEVAVVHLAAVYSGHPDYRQEWKP